MGLRKVPLKISEQEPRVESIIAKKKKGICSRYQQQKRGEEIEHLCLAVSRRDAAQTGFATRGSKRFSRPDRWM